MHGESDVVPRVSDLESLGASTQGKVEIEALEEGREEQIIEHLMSSAVLTVFREAVPQANLRSVVDAFEDGRVVSAGDDIAAADYPALLADLPELSEPVRALAGSDQSPAAVAAAVEFVLEGLHLSKRLNKEAVGSRANYRRRG